MSLDISLIIRKTKEVKVFGCYYRIDGERCYTEIDEWNRLNPDNPLPSTGIIDDTDYVFEANITHNLGEMALAAGIYHEVWAPDEVGIKFAKDLIAPLKAGIEKMVADPEAFKKFDARNNWGTYAQFLPWLRKYLQACINSPNAEICVSQ